MVQAFDAQTGDGVPVNEVESAHANLIGEVIDFVKEHKVVSTIAGLGIAAGAVYCARAPIGRFLSKCGGSIFAAEEALGATVKAGETPLGRRIAVAGAEAEEAIVSSAKTTETSHKPLLAALDDAVKSGRAKTAPEPWAYNQEHRGLLKDLPKGGSDLKPAGQSIETLETITSTQTPDRTDITRIAFPSVSKPTAIDVAKHRFLSGK